MKNVSEVLTTIRQMVKLYEVCLEETREKYGLSGMEIRIISFLHNNPGKDTVADIATMRVLSKGNVSRGAESLIQKGLLERVPDKVDRRCVHLFLLPKADEIVEDIENASDSFEEQIMNGFSGEEIELFAELNERFLANIKEGLERGKK